MAKHPVHRPGVLGIEGRNAPAGTIGGSTARDVASPAAMPSGSGSFDYEPGGTLVRPAQAGGGTVFSGTYRYGIVLSSPTTQNPATIGAGAYVTNIGSAHNGDAVYGTNAAAWTLTNFGKINAAVTHSHGVNLTHGGVVTNGSTSATTALIEGSRNGVAITGAVGTISNFGTIASTSASDFFAAGIAMSKGGAVANAVSGLIASYRDAVYIGGFGGAGVAGTVTNLGTIASTGTGASAVQLAAGGTVANQGLLTGGFAGVLITGAAGTVTNSGTIDNTSGSYNNAVTLGGGGIVNNDTLGLISGTYNGVRISGGLGTVVNDGTIAGRALYSGGPSLYAGGAIINGESGLITALFSGAWIVSGPATVTNYGRIVATGQFNRGYGVFFYDTGSGTVTNAAGAYIGGHGIGVAVVNGSGTVSNQGSIIGDSYEGIFLGSGTITNGAPTATNALIAGYDGVRIYGGLLSNFGTIVSTGTSFLAQAVDFLGAGTLVNQAAILGTNTYASGINAGYPAPLIINGSRLNSAATIAGWLNGVDQFSGTATIVNYGTITSSNGDGVYIAENGIINNVGAAAWIVGAQFGIQEVGFSGTVVNDATIAGTGSAAIGVYLGAGGLVLNGPDAARAAIGGASAIVVAHAPGTVENYGTVIGTGLAIYGRGVVLADGGTIANAGVISAHGALGAEIFGAAGNVTNAGTIVSTTAGGYYYAGVFVVNGGDVTNQQGGLIDSSVIGVALAQSGTVANFGTVSTNYGFGGGVDLAQGGLVVNGGAGVTSARIVGGTTGISVVGAAGTVVNFATVQGTGGVASGIYFGNGGTVANYGAILGSSDGVRIEQGAGTVLNTATISANGIASDGILMLAGGVVSNGQSGAIFGDGDGVAIALAGGTVVNSGAIAATGSGYPDAIYLGAGGFVDNLGTVSAPGGTNGVAVNLVHGGTVTNVAGGRLQASGDAVVLAGSTGDSGTVVNNGIIAGGGDGVDLKLAGSTLVNNGTVTGIGAYGLYLYNGGAVVNSAGGVIEGHGGIIATHAAATIVNSGTVIGSGVGVQLKVAGSTLTNAGTIAGSTGAAVAFSAPGGRLVVDPGAVFGGAVIGYAGDTLEFAPGAGTLGGLGASLAGFTTVTVDTAADWVFTGTDAIAAGVTLTDAGDATFAGPLANDGIIAIGADAKLSLNSTVSGGGIVEFAGSAGTLAIYGSGMPTNTIGGLAPGDGIDLRSLAWSASNSASYNPATHILTATGIGAGNTFHVTGVAAGTQFAVYDDGSGGTLVKAVAAGNGTNFSGTYTSGIVLSSPARQNPSTVTATGYVTNTTTSHNGDAVYGTSAVAWDFTNFGKIVAAQAGSDGVHFAAGGTVTNEASGTIASYNLGALIKGSPGTVINFGVIEHVGSGTSGEAVYLGAGGVVSNYGQLVGAHAGNGTSGYPAVVAAANKPATVINTGTIANPNNSNGINLLDGGLVINGRNGAGAALITAQHHAIYTGGTLGVPTSGALGTIVNYGTIESTGTSTAIAIVSGGTVTNYGLIRDVGNNAISVGGSIAATIVNFGTIADYTPAHSAIYISAGGVVTNVAGAVISSPRTGIAFNNTTGALVSFGSVDNAGTIASSGVTAGAGIYFGQGGVLTNRAGGTISAYLTGVSVKGNAGTIINSGVIEHVGAGTSGEAVYFGAGGLLRNYGLITGARAGTSSSNGYPGAIEAKNQAVTVVNFATIANANNSDGINLDNGGLVVNGSNAINTALITAQHAGIYIGGTLGTPTPGAVGTVVNYGTIESTGTNAAVRIVSGGTVTNYGTIQALGRNAVSFGGSVSGTVSNFGLIANNTTAFGAIYLGAGGVVTNAAGAVITSPRSGISFNNTTGAAISFGSINNSGTIVSTGTSVGNGIYFGQGGYLDNAAGGLITAYRNGLLAKNSPAAVDNLGTIRSTGRYAGIALDAGGIVANSGLISGGAQGVYGTAGPTTVINAATIAAIGITGAGVYLGAGYVRNGAYGSAALITGSSSGVVIAGAGSIVVNYGTITGATGIALRLGGAVANYGDVLGNGTGIYLGGGGSLENGGPSSRGVVSTGDIGVSIHSGYGLVDNFDAVAGGNIGIRFEIGATARLANLGAIVGPGSAGVSLYAGSIGNYGGALIEGGDGVAVRGAGVTIVNDGTIAAFSGSPNGTGAGVAFHAGNGTLVNDGTVAGANGTAVSFFGGGNRLVLEPGAVFAGAVFGGGGGSDVLELAGYGEAAGNIAGLGTTYTGFDQILVDSTAVWQANGGNAIDPAVTVAVAGALAFTGNLDNEGAIEIDPAATLVLDNAASGSGSVDFVGTSGLLVVGSTVMPTNTIIGFNEGDVIDLAAVAGGGADQLSLDANNLLTVSAGGQTFQLQLDPQQSFAGEAFTLTGDGNGGTEIGLATASSVISAGQVLHVGSGQVLSGLVVLSGGVLDVDAGGTAVGTLVEAGGIENIASGGTDIGATIESGGFQDDAGLSNGALIVGGGRQTVEPSGVALNAVLDESSVQTVSGAASGTTVGSGDTEIVAAGGTASNTTVSAGGSLIVEAGGAAVAAVVFGGGTETVSAGAVDTHAMLAGGVQDVFGAANGAVIGGGGLQLVEAGGSETNTTIGGGGRLELSPGANALGTMAFAGSGTLQIDGTTMPTAPIAGFDQTDAIDLRAVSFSSSLSATFDSSTDTLTISGGGVFEQLTIAGFPAGMQFVLSPDGFGGTTIGLTTASGPNLLVNGGFEASTSNVSTPPGWTNIGHIDGVIAYSQFPSQPVYEGLEFYDLGGFGDAAPPVGDGIEQTVATTPGVSYTLTFGLSSENLSGTETLRVAIGNQFTDYTLVPTGTGVFTRPFVTEIIPYTATGTSTTIAFTILSASPATGSNDPLIDGVIFSPSSVEAPPPPTGLALSSASDSGVPGDNDTNITTPTITGQGVVGDTVSLFDGSTLLGTGTVAANGTWSIVTTPLVDGLHALTATQSDNSGLTSSASAALDLTVDTSPPQTTPTSLLTLANGSPAPIGIAAPSDPNDPSSALSITVDALPTNGSVTLGNGAAVSQGEQLTVAQLTGLVFIPGSSSGSSSFTYTVTDPAGNSTAGTATFSVTATQLFDFVFTYNNSQDYYYGTVADSGNFGYTLNETISAGAGTYTIIGSEGATGEASGSVFVTSYAHIGPGQATPVPLDTAAGHPDGAQGLGSESDAVLGSDGQAHAFTPETPATFTVTPLFGFVYTYADGTFYSGTVADDGRFGTTAGTRSITDASGNFVGSYSIFGEGVTAAPTGTVAVNRVTIGGQSFVPNGGGTANGTTGLGSETGSITVNGQVVAFSDLLEPRAVLTLPIVPVTPPPPPADVYEAETNQIFADVLGRNPTADELAAYSGLLAAGSTTTAIRQILASSTEGQNDLNQLFLQIFNTPIDAADAATYTNDVTQGSSLAALQLILAQSPQAQAALNQLYEDVLGRPIDGMGLTTYMGVLANGGSLDSVRNTLASSPEAQTDLNQMFQAQFGRTTTAAELVGMEDRMASGVATQQSVQNAMGMAGAAVAGYAAMIAQPGGGVLTAQAGVPTMFQFGGSFDETIVGFDPARDTLELPSNLAIDFAAFQQHLSAVPGGTEISLGPNQAIFLAGIAPGAFGPGNLAIGEPTGQQFLFQISPVPDVAPPSFVHQGAEQVAAGQTVTISPNLLQFDDNVSPHAAETYTVTNGPANGTLLKNGEATSSFTQADIDNGLISYHETVANVIYDRFSFTVADAANNQRSGFFQFHIRPPSDKAPSDFSNDGISDVLFQNTGSGDTGFWQINNGVSRGWVGLGGSNSAYHAVATGDFGVGTSDILFQNVLSGDTGYWNMQNGVSLGWHDLGGSDSAYHAVATGDFFGDGTSDILFQNTLSGDTGFWQMSNGVSSGWVGLGGSDSAYHAVATGDFFGDGTSDILFQNSFSGDTGFWQMSNGVSSGWVGLGGSDSAYHAVATGDFFGDGTADILFQNFDTGDTGYWKMQGGTSLGWEDLGGSNPDYRVVGTGDYLGGGTSDILFQNRTTGDTGFWKMINGVATGWVDLGGSNSAYHAIG